MSICGATDTPVLDFWWRLLWVSKPEWVLPYSNLAEAYLLHVPRDVKFRIDPYYILCFSLRKVKLCQHIMTPKAHAGIVSALLISLAFIEWCNLLPLCPLRFIASIHNENYTSQLPQIFRPRGSGKRQTESSFPVVFWIDTRNPSVSLSSDMLTLCISILLQFKVFDYLILPYLTNPNHSIIGRLILQAQVR